MYAADSRQCIWMIYAEYRLENETLAMVLCRVLVSNRGIVRVTAIVWLLVQRGRVLGLLVDGAALVFLGQKLLDFPVVLLDADGKLEIFARDGIPVLFLESLANCDYWYFSGATNLVNHHDCEKIADGRKEEAIKIVLDIVADGVAEDVEDNLANNEEEDAKANVAQWPAVLECANNEDDLADHVYEEEDGVDDVGYNKDADGVGGAQAGPVLEGEQ